jgi:hypothetical protein
LHPTLSQSPHLSKSHAPHVVRVGLETGATSTCLWTALGNPNDASGLTFLGDLQLRVQRPDLAIQAFRRAVPLASGDDLENGAYARKMVARLLLGTDDAQARNLLDEASQYYQALGDRDALAEIARLSK